MSTSRKLWLGFGTLTALLVLTVMTIIVQLRAIQQQVDGMANAERPRSAAARELEINVLDYALGVRTYLQSGDPSAAQEMAKDAADLEVHLTDYVRLAVSERQRELATRFQVLWRDLKSFGLAMTNARNRETDHEDMSKFSAMVDGLDTFLDDELQADAIESYDARKNAAERDVQTSLGMAGFLLVAGTFIAAVTSAAVGRGVVRNERLLQANGELWRVTLASIGDAVITTDTAGRITYLNTVAEALTGCKQTQAAGQALDAVFRIENEETRHPVENPATRSLREGRIVGLANHTVLIAQDGTERAIDDSAAPIRDERGHVAGCVLVFKDVSERRQAEAQLREGEERLHFVMDSMPQKIFTATPVGDVDYFNPQWSEFTGLSFEQIRDWGWTQFIHPDDVADNRRVWMQSIDSGEPFSFEHRFRRSDGEYRWHISRAVAFKDGRGNTIMWIGSNTDIHEQKLMADELRQLAADLAEEDRRKDEFLAMLAHELRNPLAPIRNALQIMRLRGADAQARHSTAAMMERQVGHMVRLVDDLLDASRISRGRIELRKVRTELASAMNHAVETIRPLCESMDHQLTITLPPEPIYLDADPTRLAQMVANLLGNSCKFTDPGGRIWLSAEQEGEHAVIRVQDTGIGILADQVPRIFDMFMQADTSLQRSVSGLGIGLTVVKQMVEMHNGTVQAHSAGAGQGSEFVVRLPIVIETSASPAPEPAAAGSAGAGVRRILVVDDNQDSATSLAMWLELSGHETQAAYDGLEAAQAAAAFRPDIVLLDIGLPKLDGYEVARRIRGQPWGENMVLIAVTGWGKDEDRQRSREAGFDAHLVKPVDPETLTKMLASLSAPGNG